MGASTNWSRRSVLVLSASAVGAAALAGPLGSAASAAKATGTSAGTTPSTALTGLRRDHWTPLVGKRVVVDGPAGRVRATVAGIEDLQSASAADAGRFAVELRTDRGQAVNGLSTVTIPGRGVTTLLLTAVDRSVRHRSTLIVVNNPGT
ncbi:MAG TPA: hypothetical protein VF228_14230 [Iamia sp.]